MAGVGCPMTRHSKRIFCPSVHSRSLRSWVNLGGTTSEVTMAVEMSLTSLRAVESNTRRRIKYKYQNKWLWHYSFLSVSYFVRNMPKQLPHKIFKSNTTQELSFTYLLCLGVSTLLVTTELTFNHQAAFAFSLAVGIARKTSVFAGVFQINLSDDERASISFK